MAKIDKPSAGYLSARLIGTEGGPGTKCSRCRDFIKSTGECLILTDPQVSAEHGTCTQFLRGEPYTRAKPLRLVPKEVVGYIEGEGVPTYCGVCKYYQGTGKYHSQCDKVEGMVDYAGCCNLYHYDAKTPQSD